MEQWIDVKDKFECLLGYLEAWRHDRPQELTSVIAEAKEWLFAAAPSQSEEGKEDVIEYAVKLLRRAVKLIEDEGVDGELSEEINNFLKDYHQIDDFLLKHFKRFAGKIEDNAKLLDSSPAHREEGEAVDGTEVYKLIDGVKFYPESFVIELKQRAWKMGKEGAEEENEED